MSQVYWFKDGKQISKRSEHYRISRDADGTCSLHTVAASLDDDGNYTIMASNPEVSSQGQGSLWLKGILMLIILRLQHHNKLPLKTKQEMVMMKVKHLSPDVIFPPFFWLLLVV